MQPVTFGWGRRNQVQPKGDRMSLEQSVDRENQDFPRIRAKFRHSNLHILFVASRDSHSFSEFMLHAFLTNFTPSWGFNHVRLINLCDPPLLPRTKPLIDQSTASVLIINKLDDLTPRAQVILKQYCSALTHRGPFLALVNVPRYYRCQAGLMRRAKRRAMEKIHMDFFMTILSDSIKEIVIFRALACPKYDSSKVVRKVFRWLLEHNVPIPYSQSEILGLKDVSNVAHPTRQRPLRYHEYEDLPNPRRNMSIFRKTKSTSLTQLKLADRKTPHYRPEEPRYDAEFDEFRTRRDTRRFVRRLRDAMRDFRRVVVPEPLDGHLAVSTLGTVRFGVGSNLTGLTVAEADEALEDDRDEEDDHDADDENEEDDGPGEEGGDEAIMEWDDDEEEEGGTPSTTAPSVSMTSSIATELEPTLLRMRLLQMADRAASNVHTERRHLPLPVDSLETIFTNSTFRQGSNLPVVPRRVQPEIRLIDRDHQSDRTATTYRRFRQGISEAEMMTTTGTTLSPSESLAPRPGNGSYSGSVFSDSGGWNSFDRGSLTNHLSLMSETEQEDRAVWESLRAATVRAPTSTPVPVRTPVGDALPERPPGRRDNSRGPPSG